MDVLPDHLNRDSFRDSLKGLVALEIIIDLPFGFPINNIISQNVEETESRSVHNFWTCKKKRLRSADFRLKNVFGRKICRKSALRSCIFFARPEVVCTDLNPTLLYILIFRAYTKFVWKNQMPALGVYFPQPCSSAGCRFAASRLLLQYYRRIV